VVTRLTMHPARWPGTSRAGHFSGHPDDRPAGRPALSRTGTRSRPPAWWYRSGLRTDRPPAAGAKCHRCKSGTGQTGQQPNGYGAWCRPGSSYSTGSSSARPRCWSQPA